MVRFWGILWHSNQSDPQLFKALYLPSPLLVTLLLFCDRYSGLVFCEGFGIEKQDSGIHISNPDYHFLLTLYTPQYGVRVTGYEPNGVGGAGLRLCYVWGKFDGLPVREVRWIRSWKWGLWDFISG